MTRGAGGATAPFASLVGLPAATLRLRPGASLFRQDDPTAALHLLERGRLRLQRHSPDGALIVLHSARDGETFAEAALFAPTYHCDAVALSECTVIAWPKETLLAALREDPERALQLAAVLAGQLRTLRGRLESRNIRSAPERVLHHLAKAGGELTVPRGGLAEFAAELGLSAAALYRTLAALAAEGAIRREAGRLSLAPRRASDRRQQQG